MLFIYVSSYIFAVDSYLIEFYTAKIMKTCIILRYNYQ